MLDSLIFALVPTRPPSAGFAAGTGGYSLTTRAMVR